MNSQPKYKLISAVLFIVNGGVIVIGLFIPPLTSSILFLPFSLGFLVARLTMKEALWLLGTLLIVSLLGYGLWGMIFWFFIPIWIGFLIPAIWRSWVGWILGVMLMLGLVFAVIGPTIGLAGPAARAANDLCNVKQIALAIQMYHDAHGNYPDALSQLRETTDSLKLFISPRGAHEIDTWREGPLRRLRRESNPGPVRQITSWTEVDGGDYLYRKPVESGAANAIMLMTRPGLLSRDWITVGYVDGHAERLESEEWRQRASVIKFLKQTGVAIP